MKFRFYYFFASIALYLIAEMADALTANRVWYEFHPKFYRIYMQYTIPALRELREATIELKNKKEAEKFYWSLVRGADFYLRDNKIIFISNQKKPDPW